MCKCPFCGQEEESPRGILELEIPMEVIAGEYKGKVTVETRIDPKHYDEIMFKAIDKAKEKKSVVWKCPKCNQVMKDADIVAFYHDGKYS